MELAESLGYCFDAVFQGSYFTAGSGAVVLRDLGGLVGCSLAGTVSDQRAL